MEEKKPKKKKEAADAPGSTFTISGNNNSVVVGSSDVGMTHGEAPAEGGEMENDLVRVFRGFSMREKTRCLQGVYDFQDVVDQERADREEQENGK